MRKPKFLFPTWSDTNQAVQLQKMARCLKFRIKEVEGLNFPCSENKGADQLRGSASSFSHMQNVGFLMTRLKCDILSTMKNQRRGIDKVMRGN